MEKDEPLQFTHRWICMDLRELLEEPFYMGSSYSIKQISFQ